jgi:hypothetical protein
MDVFDPHEDCCDVVADAHGTECVIEPDPPEPVEELR